MEERESRVVLPLEEKITLFEYRKKNPAVPFSTIARIFSEKWDKNQPAITDFLRKNKQTNTKRPTETFFESFIIILRTESRTGQRTVKNWSRTDHPLKDRFFGPFCGP